MGDDLIISVDNRPGNPSQADFVQLSMALSSSKEHSQIILSEGIYAIDNPVRLSKKGLKIIGHDSHRTVIRPKNAGQAMFVLEADGIVIGNLEINALTDQGNERATFALLLSPGVQRVGVVDTQILHTGASSILGHSIRKSYFLDNRIVNAGDDGVQLSGKGITVTNNIIVGVYDEPIDVIGGEQIFIKNNYVTHGRIGITVGNTTQVMVQQNSVVNQTWQGMVIHSNGKGIVSDNVINGTQKTSFVLHSPSLVSGNMVENSNSAGFLLQQVQEGIIEGNLVKDSERGFKFENVRDSLLRSNVFCRSNLTSTNLESDVEGRHSEHVSYVVRNRQMFSTPKEIKQTSCDLDELRDQKWQVHQKELINKPERPLEKLMAIYEEKNRGPENITIKGHSDKDKQIGAKIRNFLGRHNPGFLSISVNGAIMNCEISDDLYKTMKGAAQLAVGLFRVPYMLFRDRSGTPAAMNYLTHKGEQVAVVSSGWGLSDIRIYPYNENNTLDLSDRLKIWIYQTINEMKSWLWILTSKV